MSEDLVINQGSKDRSNVIKTGTGQDFEDEKLKEGQIVEVVVEFKNIFKISYLQEYIIVQRIQKIKNNSNFDLVYSNFDKDNNKWIYQIKYNPQFRTTGAGTILAISLGSIALITWSAYLIMDLQWKIRNPLANIGDQLTDWKLIASIGMVALVLNSRK